MNFGSFHALSDVLLDIGAGEFIVLLGPSGCGKSTLLSIIGGFLTPTSGNVLIDGKDMTHVPPSTRPTTAMFQDYALFSHMPQSTQLKEGDSVDVSVNPADIVAVSLLALAS